jgi:hypothetical protein
MTDHSPESLSDIEILDILQSMKDDELDTEAKRREQEEHEAEKQKSDKAYYLLCRYFLLFSSAVINSYLLRVIISYFATLY